MSYWHPTAERNSAGFDPDPITPARERIALDYLDGLNARGRDLSLYNPLSSWKRITEDVIHFTPFDSLPQKEQDAIRLRRRRNFQKSSIPWIVTDYGSLMNTYDDIDDLLKTKRLIQDYALTPAARLAHRLAKGRKPFRDALLDGWRDSCDPEIKPRQRKLAIPGFGGLNFLASLGLGALSALFPSWRLVALGLQALQTTDAFFGVGIQLGPILGYALELFFRGLEATNGPIFHFENKYEQLKAARVLRGGNKLLAAAPHADPDDAWTALTGFYYASDADIMPILVIDPDDYPSLTDVFTDWGAWAKEGFDAVRLAASLPYNLGALAVNNFLGDALMGMSQMTGGPGYGASDPTFEPDNETRAFMKLAEAGICPGPQCEAEMLAGAYLLANYPPSRRRGTQEPMSLIDAARNLDYHVTDPITALPEPHIP